MFPLTNRVFAQRDSSCTLSHIYNTLNNENDNLTWLLKAMFAPLPIGNQITSAATVGVDFGLRKHQSFGSETNQVYTFGSHDQTKDTAGVYYEVGAHYSSSTFALLLNYRYYLRDLSLNSGFNFYLSPFIRKAKTKAEQDPQFAADYISKISNEFSLGLVLGTLIKFKENERFGLDINLGASHKWSSVHTVYLENKQELRKHEVLKKIVPRIGFNFYWRFFY